MLKFTNKTNDKMVNKMLEHPELIPLGFKLSLALTKPSHALELISKDIINMKYNDLLSKMEYIDYTLYNKSRYNIPVINIAEGKYSGLGIIYHYLTVYNNLELPVFVMNNFKMELTEE